MVAVAIAAHLAQAPTCSQEGRELPIDHHTTLVCIAVATRGQLQVFLHIVLEEPADIACVIEVAVSEAAGLLSTVVLTQQSVALGHSVTLVAIHPRFIVAPAVPVFSSGKAGQVFIWRAVALVLVLSRQYKNLVVLAVVIAARVGKGVVDLRIVGIVENAVNVQPFKRVRAFSLLLTVKHPFFKNSGVGAIAMVFFKALARLLIAVSEFLLQLLDIPPLIQRS